MGDGRELNWGIKVRVVFKNPGNDKTYKKMYIRPDTAIDPAGAPKDTELTEAPAPAGYQLGGWRRYGSQDLWNFATIVTADDSPMTLLAVWGLKAPIVTVTANTSTIHGGNSIVLTTDVTHELTGLTYHYQWYRDGSLLDGETGSALTVNIPGSYQVKVTASDGNAGTLDAVGESNEVTCTAEGHAYDHWNSNEDYHWLECACGSSLSASEHISNDGRIINGKRIYSCIICGRVLRTEVIDDTETEHHHNFGDAWKCDSLNHGHECACGEKADVHAHVFGDWTITKEASADEDGSRQRICPVCGYSQTDVIPATGSASDTTDPDTTDPEISAPETGADTGMGWFSLLLISLGGLLVVGHRRHLRKEK